MTRVLIIATGRTADAGPTAALPYGGGREAPTLLTRLCQRLDTLNVPDRHVVTRPELAPPLRKDGHDVIECEDVAADLREIARLARTSPGSRGLRAQREDGPLSTGLGRLAGGTLPPLPGTVLAAVAATGLTITGFTTTGFTITGLTAAGPGGVLTPALCAPVIVLLLAGPGAAHPHTGPMDWLVPPIIRGIEYGYLAVLGFAQGVSAPLVYVLIAVLAFHHHDTVYRSRLGLRPQAWALRAGLGWEGRMLLAALAGLCGLLPFAYAALAAYLGVLFAGESVTTWARTGHDSGVMVDLEDEEA